MFPRMDIYPPAKQRPALLQLAAHLDSRTSALRRDECFGHWTVIHPASKPKYGHLASLCRCACGNEAIVPNSDLLRGKSKSFGCARREACAKRCREHRNSQHGLTGTHGVAPAW